MKKIIIIGASYLQLPLIMKAREMGLETHVFAWEDGAVGKGACEYFYPISIVEKEKILACAESIAPDGVVSIASDLATVTVNFLAEHLGLTGNSMEATLCSTNKYAMRRKLHEGRLQCPQFTVCNAARNVDPCKFAYPLIVKPTDRSGSRGVTRVERADDLPGAIRRALKMSFKAEAIIEDYIEGREISVEMISWKGVHHPLAITDKITTGAPFFVELEHHQPAEVTSSRTERILQLVTDALDCLKIRNGASHSELLLTSDGRNVIVEIGGRMGGDCIGSDLVYLSTGYDFLRGVIEIALGQFSGVQMTKNMHAGICYAKHSPGRVLKVQDHSHLYTEILKTELEVEPGQRLGPIKQSSDRRGYYIYSSVKRFCPPEEVLKIEVAS